MSVVCKVSPSFPARFEPSASMWPPAQGSQLQTQTNWQKLGAMAPNLGPSVMGRRFQSDCTWPNPTSTSTDHAQLIAPEPTVLAEPLTHNDVWRHTPTGADTWISMSGPNRDVNGKYLGPGAEPAPRWENAFIANPINPASFVWGYAREAINQTTDLVTALLGHTADTAFSMAQRGELAPWPGSPMGVNYQVGEVLREAWVKPFAQVAAQMAADPDRTINAAGDGAAAFTQDYVANLQNRFHTRQTSAEAGAATYMMLSVGITKVVSDLIARITGNIRRDNEWIRSLAKKDLRSELNEAIKNSVRGARAAAHQDIAAATVVTTMPHGAGVTYAYTPSSRGMGGEKLSPSLDHVSGFNQFGYSALYEPKDRTLAIDINAHIKELPELRHAWGDEKLMISTLLDMLQVDRRPVDRIFLRPGELQLPSAQRTPDVINLRVDANDAVRAARDLGYKVIDPGYSKTDDIYVVLEKIQNRH